MADYVKTERYNALGDDGQNYVLVRRVEMLRCPTAADPDREDEGVESWRTSDGMKLFPMENGQFEIEGTGVIVKVSQQELS